MKRILITGAAGFIGSFLTESCLSKDYHVIGIDNFFRGSEENLNDSFKNENFTFYEMDLANNNSVKIVSDILRDFEVDTVIHMAAINGTEYFYDSSYFVLDHNIKITQNVLSAMEGSRVDKIIYASSSEVYGDPITIPTPESHKIILNSYADRDSYASSKAIGDYYVRLFSEKNSINWMCLRIFNQYGPRMIGTKYGQVVAEFINRALSQSEDFTIIGNGNHTRSFCYVKDCVEIIINLVKSGMSGYFNIGNDEEISINQLAEIIHIKIGREFKPTYLAERAHDHLRRCPDLTRLKSALPETLFTDLSTGLDLTIEYYKNRAIG